MYIYSVDISGSFVRETRLQAVWFQYLLIHCMFWCERRWLALLDDETWVCFLDYKFIFVFIAARWLVKKVVLCSRCGLRNGIYPFHTTTSCHTRRLEVRKCSCRRRFDRKGLWTANYCLLFISHQKWHCTSDWLYIPFECIWPAFV